MKMPLTSVHVVADDAVSLVRDFVKDRWSFGDLFAELQPTFEISRGFRGWPNKEHLVGRYGLSGVMYVYDGRKKIIHEMTPMLELMRSELSETLSHEFNCCYVNVYMTGNESLPRHSDTQKLPQLGDEPVIAMIRLGAERAFQLWSSSAPRDKNKMTEVTLYNGDLLIMYGRSQRDFLHSVPKQKHIDGMTMSLTFRYHSSL